MPIDAFSVLCAQPTRDLLAIAKFLFIYCTPTECSCTPCPKTYTPLLLTVSCCNLSAILLINTLNTVRLSLRSHQRSSALSSLSDSATESESWLFLPLIVASTKTPLKYDCSFPLVLYRIRLDFWFTCVATCTVVSRRFWHATYDCVAPYVDIILHRRRFWAKSAASGSVRWSLVLFQILLDGAEPRDAGTT